MKKVESSNVAAIGYSESDSILQIEFCNGSMYQYFDVPKHVFDDLSKADSVGGYLAANIKGVYRYTRV